MKWKSPFAVVLSTLLLTVGMAERVHAATPPASAKFFPVPPRTRLRPPPVQRHPFAQAVKPVPARAPLSSHTPPTTDDAHKLLLYVYDEMH